MYDINKSKMTDTDGMTLCASVINRLEINGEKNRVKEILTAIRGECEIIDYRTMLPCPPVPEKEVGEPEREAAAAYLLAANPDSEDFGIEKLGAEDFKKISFAFFDSWGVMPLGESERFNIDAAKYGEKFAEIIKEFGCPTAQDWRRENWGTLVNPVGAEMLDENTIRFFTYYECADKFTKALSERFPDVTLKLEYSDSCLGEYTGRYEFKSGEIAAQEYYDSEEKAALELSAKLWDVDLEDCGYVYDTKSDNYVYTNDSPQMC